MKKLLTISILTIISILSVTFIIYPKKSFSEIENRVLASMPTFSISKIIDGDYMEDFETYINDNFPLRDLFMNIRTISYKLIGKQNVNDVYFGKDNYLLENYNTFTNQDKIIDTINKLYDNNSSISMSVMLIPTKISIYENKLPNNVKIDNQEEIINNIYNKLNQNINKVQLYNTLINERNNYQLYYKTDHHWTSYGAYFGYKEFCSKNNISYIEISNFNIETVSNSFKGSTYSKVVYPYSHNEKIDIFNYQDYDLDVEYIISNKKTKSLYNYDYLNKKDKYAMFLDNNHPLITITNNDIKNDTNILIIKDSYANSMIPFLINHYNKIHVIDPRYYKKSTSKYIKENNIQNVLILYNVGTLYTDNNIFSIR